MKKYEADCKNIDELLEAIGKLPTTIKSLEVPTSMVSFQPLVKVFKDITDMSEMVDICREILTEATSEDQVKRYGELISCDLQSYCGDSDPKGGYYVRLHTKKSIQFAEDMSNGVYGSLD